MHGATIIEVMVSVFLLTFGILALMLSQIRSVAGIGEAENRTLVAQAAEALAEGMQVNPTGRLVNNRLEIVYPRYTAIAGNGRAVSATPTALTHLTAITNKSKDALAQAQLNNFESALSQISDVAVMHYIVCADNNNPAAPTLNGNVFNGQCATANLVPGAVIKVAWRMKNATGNNANDTQTFTYMLKVRG